MSLQRALLAFFAVMLLSAVVASLARGPQLPTVTDAPPATTIEETHTLPDEPRTDDAAEARTEDADALELKVGDNPGRPTFPRERHLILTVRSDKPGQIAIPGLGLVTPVVPGTPAMFDLFTDRAGEFPVEFTPAEGGTAVLVDTLVVAREDEMTTGPESSADREKPSP